MDLVPGLFGIGLGSLLLFLGSPNQNWLARPLPRTRSRRLAALLLLAGLARLSTASQVPVTLFLAASTGMLVLLACPYLGVALAARRKLS